MRARSANPVKSGSDYESSMPKRADRVLVAAALALAVAVGWDALAHRTHAVPAAQPPPAAVPQLVRLVPSSTAFLPNCPSRDLRLALGPGAQVTLHFSGTRCHVPPLHLTAVLRGGDGRVVYRGPALAAEDLSGNFAGTGVRQAGLIGCRGSAPLHAAVAGSGLAASGTIRCP